MARIKDTMFNITYTDGDILYGADLNKIIDVFELAINTNKKDINKLLTGSDYFYIAETLTGLTSLIAEQVPDEGARGYVFSDDDEGSLNVYTYDETTGEWVFLANRSFYDEIEALQIEQEEIRATQATNRVDIDDNTAEIDTAKGRITVNENNIDNVEGRLDIVEPIVTNNTNRVTAVEIKASNNETNIATNRADIDSNDIDIASNKARLTATELATSTNETNIATNSSNINLKEDKANKGVANGYAPLNESGVIDSAFVPNAYNDYIEVATYADLPTVGVASNLYIVKADETSGGDLSTYFWATDTYVPIHDTQSSTDIKVKYESNADTNAFTDSEKAKLLSLLTGSDYYSSSEVESRLNDLLTLGILQDTLIYAENGNDYISRLGTIPISYLSPYNWVYFKMTLSDDNVDHFGLFKQSEATSGALVRVNLANKIYGVLTNVGGVNAQFAVTDDANAEKVVNATCKFWGLKTTEFTPSFITIEGSFENGLINGNFATPYTSAINDWRSSTTTGGVINQITSEDNVATITVLQNNASCGLYKDVEVLPTVGVKYFHYCAIKPKYDTLVSLGYTSGLAVNTPLVANQFNYVGLFETISTSASFFHVYHSSLTDYSINDTWQVKDVMSIPMTGYIAEYTEEQMIELAKQGYFEGTKSFTLQNKLDAIEDEQEIQDNNITNLKATDVTHSVAIANNAISIEALNEAVYENETTLNYTGDFTVANVAEKTVPSSYLVKGISVPQILDNGNFDNLGEWNDVTQDTLSIADNIVTISVGSTSNSVYFRHPVTIGAINHYFCCALVKTDGTSQTSSISMPASSTNSTNVTLTANTFTYVYALVTASSNSTNYAIQIYDTEAGDTIQVKEAMCIPMTGALANYTEAQMLALVKKYGYIDTLASVGGPLEIDEGSNQLDYSFTNNTSYYVENNALFFTDLPVTNTSFVLSDYIFKANQIYTVTIYDYSILDNYSIGSFYFKGATIQIGEAIYVYREGVTFTLTEDCRLLFYASVNFKPFNCKLMINKGTVAMPYVPYNANYTPQSITVPTLRSFETTQDTFEVTTGVLTQNVADDGLSILENPETIQYDMQEIPLLDTGYYGSYTGVAPTSSIVIPTNLAGALKQTIDEQAITIADLLARVTALETA